MDEGAINAILAAVSKKPDRIVLDEEHQIVILPNDMTIADISKYLPPPPRVKQAVTMLSVPAFVAYVTRFHGPNSTVFANEASAFYEAVLDYHSEGTASTDEHAGTADHIVRYQCPESLQWGAWMKSDGSWTDQESFARFLETNLKDITTPAGAVFLEIALQMQIHKAAEFASEVNLDNGQVRFRYEETLKSGTKKAGDMTIPSAFQLTLPVFIDGAKFNLDARFRYTLNDGKLKVGYQLIRPLEVYQAAVKQVTKEIADGLKGVALYAGHRN